MISKFNRLSTKNKWIIGIISSLLFPITLILIAADISINGFKEGKIVKIFVGVYIILMLIGVFWQNSLTVPAKLYEEQIREFYKVKNQFNVIKSKLKEKEKLIEKSSVYLKLNDEEKNKVDKYIGNIKNK